MDAETVRDILMLRSLQAPAQLISKCVGVTVADVNGVLKGGRHWDLLKSMEKMSEKSAEELWERLTASLEQEKRR